MNEFIKDTWLKFVREDKLEDLINSIENFIKNSGDGELLYELLVINSNYTELKKSVLYGLLDDIGYSNRKNSLLKRTIGLIDAIDEKYNIANKTFEIQTKGRPRSNSSIGLQIKLNRSFEEYSLLNFKDLFTYIRNKSEQVNIFERDVVKILDFSPGSVNVVFEMSYESFESLMHNIKKEEFYNLGIYEMKLVEFSSKKTPIYSHHTEQEFDLQKLKATLKVKISENLKKGLLELKRVLNPKSELFNEFVINYARFNSNKLNRKFRNQEDFITTENQIVEDLLNLIDGIEEDDIDKNAT